MVYFTSESAKQLYQIIAPMQGYLLTLYNYEEWRFHMTWSLISQGLWHVVRGQNCSDITLDKDYTVSRSIMFAIDDSLHSKVLQRSFLSAKELWDYLRLQFVQSHDLDYDHVQQGLQAKKKSVDKCEVLPPIFTLPVIDFHDDFSLLFGDLWEDVAALPNQVEIEQCETLHLLHEHGMPNPERAIKECTECFLDLQMLNLQQQGNSQSILFDLDLDLQHEVLDNTCLLDNNEIIDLFHGEEQRAGNTQGIMEEKEELVCELPWMELDVQTDEFSSILFQVNHHVLQLPLYMNLHIPFTCTHDGKVEDHHNLDVCLGYISYPDIGGLTKQLKVSYKCLHLKNQVLIVLYPYDYTDLVSDLVSESSALAVQLLKQSLTLNMVELPKKCYELQVLPFMADKFSNCQEEDTKAFTAVSVVSCTCLQNSCLQNSAGHLHGFNLGLKAEYGLLPRQRS